jgi:hypothetical protein
MPSGGLETIVMSGLSFGDCGGLVGDNKWWTKLTSHQITCFLENAHGFISNNRGNPPRNTSTPGLGIVHFRANYVEAGIRCMGRVFEQKDISGLPGAQQYLILPMNQPTNPL